MDDMMKNSADFHAERNNGKCRNNEMTDNYSCRPESGQLLTTEGYLYSMERNAKNPEWLEQYNRGDEICMIDVLNDGDGIVYYPGAFMDGQPVETCNRAFYANVYIYADYLTERYMLEHELEIRGFKGYHLLDKKKLSKEDLQIADYTAHCDTEEKNLSHWGKPFWAQIMIFERDEEYDDSHGMKRFVFIYVCMDGIALYDALFGNYRSRLKLLVLQDHGFGCNYDRFGHGGLMEKIAGKTLIYPARILCADDTDIWNGYERITGCLPVRGGMHCNNRCLYACSRHDTLDDLYKSFYHEPADAASFYTIGSYSQEGIRKTPVDWMVLDETEDRMLLLSRYAIECHCYHESDYEAYWAISDIRKWLNTEFYNTAFSDDEKSRICLSRVPAEINSRSLVYNGPDADDYVFLLSVNEVEKYLPSCEDRICRVTKNVFLSCHNIINSNATSRWWLRTIVIDNMTVAMVSADGTILKTLEFGENDIFVPSMVRPAMWVYKEK